MQNEWRKLAVYNLFGRATVATVTRIRYLKKVLNIER
jgi:hypothetical protein